MDARETSFTGLLGRIRAGDDRAATQLVQEYAPVVRRELRFRLRDARARLQLDSMDICQSVLANFFVRVAAGQYDLKEPNDLVKLLLTMTRNKVAEKFRGQYRQRRDARLTVVVDVEIASKDPSPSRLVAGRELLGHVLRLLGDEERRLAQLRGNGLSWAEIADRTGGSPGARRKQLARAMDQVVEELGLDRM
jgi:RNA polymerase sigma factor (sigma-70 family)